MGENAESGGHAKLSSAERWATYVTRHASGNVGALVALATAVLWGVLVMVRPLHFGWVLVAAMLFVALMYWERGGFKRLLERRDQEIEQLQSRESSV